MRTGIMGAGSLGTVIGAMLTKAGVDCTLIDADAVHVRALNIGGARVSGKLTMNVPVRAVLPDEADGGFDLIVYLVKSTFDAAALPRAAQLIGSGGAMITLQNGVPEDKVAAVVGRGRTLGGAVGWAAERTGPGECVMTSDPGQMTYDIGELDGRVTERALAIKAILDLAGRAEVTENLVGIRWTKLTFNAAGSGMSAALGCACGEILDNDRALTALMCILIETIQTAGRLGVKLEPIQGLHPHMLLEAAKEDEAKARDVLRLVFNNLRNAKASMLQDLEKGRPCEVESINGYLSQKAAECGGQTPVNDQITGIIRRIEARGLRYGFHNLTGLELPPVRAYFE